MTSRNGTAIALGALTGLVLGLAPARPAQTGQQRAVGQAQAAATASKSASSGTTAQRPAATAAPAAAGKAAPAAAPAQAVPPGTGVTPAAKTGRDPFAPTIKVAVPGEQTKELVCPQGVRGIIVGQAELNGVARTTSGIIAVITTSAGGRTYFLREGQQLCNGRVSKINPDAIV